MYTDLETIGNIVRHYKYDKSNEIYTWKWYTYLEADSIWFFCERLWPPVGMLGLYSQAGEVNYLRDQLTEGY